mmetsp:Transcript_13232/g.14179  ORF Transcript_13232/g.14179 Transcript_13232/m.14179 type:complete len:263 (+) Transcript_13232:301-1089(+)
MVVGNNRNVRPVDVVNLYVLLLFCLCVVTVGVIWHSLAVPGALLNSTTTGVAVSSLPIIQSVRVASKSKADAAQEIRRKAHDSATTDETTAADLLLGLPYAPYPLELFHVGPSTVNGRGLFASVFLPHGTFTGVQWVEQNIQYVLRGNVTRRDLRIKHFQFDNRNDCNFPQQKRASMTNEELLPCFSRVLNSDCNDPSTVFVRYPWRDAHTNLIYSRTTRDLQPGDEITYDYRTAPEYTQQKEEWFVGCPPVKGGFETLDIL